MYGWDYFFVCLVLLALPSLHLLSVVYGTTISTSLNILENVYTGMKHNMQKVTERVHPLILAWLDSRMVFFLLKYNFNLVSLFELYSLFTYTLR